MGRNGSEQYTDQVISNILRPSFGALIGLWISFGISTPLLAAEQLIDRLLAEVNGEAITYSQVQTKVSKGPLIEVSPYPALESDPQERIALQDLINKTMIMQKADELDLEVSDSELQEEINKFLQRRQMTKEALMEALAQQGMSYEQYKEDFRTQSIIQMFQGRELLPQLKVTDRDVQLYYLRNSGSLGENIKLSLKQLDVSIPSDAVPAVKEGKKQLIEKVYQELEGGMPFDQAVKIYSDNESARENGGAMPQIFLKDLAPMFQNSIKDLEEGRYTRPIETPGGYFIFYVEKREFAGNDDYQKKKPQLEAALKQEEMGKLLQKWIESQRRRSNIKIKDDAVGKEKAAAS